MEMPHPGADAGFQNNKQPTKVTGVAAAAAAGAGAASVDAAAAVPSAAAQEDDECVICLDSKSKSATLAMLKCSHSFCEGCIKGWSKQETTCPLCKQEFKDYKKITQTFSPLTASGTKRKRAQPKETVVKVKKTTQAQQYAQRFAAAGGGGGMHLLGPHLNQMMMHIPQIMAIMGGHFPPGQVHAHFIARPGARAPAPAPAAAATATARAAAAAAAASSEGRSANNAIVVDAAAGVSSVLRRQGPGTSILQAVRQRPNDPVPPCRPQGPPVVIDLTGDDDNEPVPAAASGRTQSSSSSSSASSSSSSASASASSSSSSAAPARSSSGAARGTQRDQSAELNARIMHELIAMLDNGHGVFGDDDDDSDEFGGDY